MTLNVVKSRKRNGEMAGWPRWSVGMAGLAPGKPQGEVQGACGVVLLTGKG